MIKKIISLVLIFFFLNSFVFYQGTLLFAEEKEKTLEEILKELEGKKEEVKKEEVKKEEVKKEEVKEPAEKPVIAVVEFTAGEGVSKGQAGLVTRFVEEEIFKTNLFKLTERSAIETILKEIGFQQTGCTDTECALELGKMLNAEKIVVGSLSKQKNLYYINIRLIDIEKAEIEKIKTTEVRDESKFKESVRGIISEMFGVKKPEEKVVKKKKKSNSMMYILGLVAIGGIIGAAGGGGGGGNGGGSEPVPPMPPQ